MVRWASRSRPTAATPRPRLAQFESAGIDVDALAATLQSDGARSFVKAWEDLLSRIDDQVAAVAA